MNKLHWVGLGLGCLACGSQAAESAQSQAQSLSTVPYACVTMRTPDDSTAVVRNGTTGDITVAGSMRADTIGTSKALTDEQDADVTLYFDGADNVSTLGSGTTANQAGLKLKEQDPCNLVYVMYNVNPFAPGTVHAGNDEISVKVKRNDGKSTSADCPGSTGYNVVQSFKIGTSLALASYTGTVRLSVRLLPPSAGAQALILSAWIGSTQVLNATTINLNSLPTNEQPNWGGVVGMRTDNVNVRYTFTTPSAPTATIFHSDSSWTSDCGSAQAD